MTVSSEPVSAKTEPTLQPRNHAETDTSSVALSTNTAHQSLLTNKFLSHAPKAGLNPLADAAAYLFSIIGKLKQLKTYRHLNKLQKELVLEINQFQEAAKTQGYSSEYILVSRYALCATFDDVVGNTTWGGQGQWDSFSLLTVFNQEGMNNDRFFIILERLIKDPTLYIDVMEFMYICLSLGFKGNYRTTEYGSSQLEQITNALYKRIRAHHGDFTKVLSPYPIKPHHRTKAVKKMSPYWFIGSCTAIVILVIFIALGYMLDSISNQAYQELMHIGKSILYETDHP